MAEAKKDETTEVHPAMHKTVLVIFRGCLQPPNDVKPIARTGSDEKENYLNDIKLITEYVQLNKKYYYLHKIHNMDQSNSMKCDQVLTEIENAAKFCKDNKGMMLRLYYTGCGQFNTGNWCFIDGVISFQQVVDRITANWGNTNFSIMSDCSYSGNWALELVKYTGKLNSVYVPCASYPYKEACSHKLGKGGLFTLWWTEELDRNKTKKLKDCKSKIEDDQFNFDYFAPRNNDPIWH